MTERGAFLPVKASALVAVVFGCVGLGNVTVGAPVLGVAQLGVALLYAVMGWRGSATWWRRAWARRGSGVPELAPRPRWMVAPYADPACCWGCGSETRAAPDPLSGVRVCAWCGELVEAERANRGAVAGERRARRRWRRPPEQIQT